MKQNKDKKRIYLDTYVLQKDNRIRLPKVIEGNMEVVPGKTFFEDELPESCVVIEEVKTTPPNKVVIDTKMEVRSYPVIATFLERMSSASEDIKGFGASTVKSEVIAKESDEEREWKEFFARCSGATWPVGSSCTYVKQIGKLRVRNTPENLKLIDEFMDEVNARGALLEVQTSCRSSPRRPFP